MSGLIGVTDPSVEEEEGRKALEMGISVSDKHLDLLRPSARYYSIFKGKYSLIRGEDDTPLGLYDKPLPCFGCGIGWFSFLLGFLCPLMWYYATILYFGNYYRKDPRERAGLAASAIAAMGCSVILLIVVLVLIF
ncbi:ribosomal protein L18ae family [Striga asiatica]|uniref:Ribosomal protein L18ae family n=1 Tax=Striga asiatica TaxID=4170 RepID=A0A5A7PX70_STRAF|nr:ribosomal protein L18ae family [Striga asiatica]